MNHDRFAGACKQLRGKLKITLGRQRNRPLLIAAGVRDTLAGKLQEGYGRSKEQAARELKRFQAGHRDWMMTWRPASDRYR